MPAGGVGLKDKRGFWAAAWCGAVAVWARPHTPPGDRHVTMVCDDDNLSDEPELDGASGGEYGGARQRREFRGKPFEQLFTPLAGDGWKARRALWVGAGPRGDFTTEHLRRIATLGGLFARQRRLGSMAIAWRPVDGIAPDRAAQALAEGAVLANFEGTSYKTDGPPVA